MEEGLAPAILQSRHTSIAPTGSMLLLALDRGHGISFGSFFSYATSSTRMEEGLEETLLLQECDS